MGAVKRNKNRDRERDTERTVEPPRRKPSRYTDVTFHQATQGVTFLSIFVQCFVFI